MVEGHREDAGEEKPDKLSVQEILCAIQMCFANFSYGLYFGILGPFFPQEVNLHLPLTICHFTLPSVQVHRQQTYL